ncbi:MAG: hypothetical protein KGL74_00780, partial [Elusimicrobia bacterium]|nr:hypothetical protein [Elusimicrobiota bacterium]
LGRVVLHARQYGLRGMEGEVFRGMRRPLGYDLQIDDGFGAVIWDAIHAAKEESRFRSSLIKRLRTAKKDYEIRQLLELARGYAAGGDAQIKRELYLCFERGLDNGRVDGCEEIIAVDGLEGYSRMARAIGRREREGRLKADYAAEYAFYTARERYGTVSARRALRPKNLDLSAYRIALRREENRHAHRKLEKVTWRILKRRLDETGHGRTEYYGLARRFGKSASIKELGRAFEYFLAEEDPARLRTVLGVFNVADIPRYDSKLEMLARHRDPRLRARATGALSRLKHPRVRSLALESLKSRRRLARRGLELFHKNYEDKDGKRILRALKGNWPKEMAHGFVVDLSDLVEGRLPKSLVPAFVRGYDISPCAQCRSAIFRRLLSVKSAPAWMIRECRFDANDGTRELAVKADKIRRYSR